MKTALLPFIAWAFLVGLNSPLAADEVTEVPYNGMNTFMKFLETQKVKGVDCVPWYVKDSREGRTLDATEANFRVRTWQGAEHPLNIELLSSLPAEQLSGAEKKLIAEGFTHRMWIPKGDKRFLDGSIVHSLPQGSISMTHRVSASVTLPLGNSK